MKSPSIHHTLRRTIVSVIALVASSHALAATTITYAGPPVPIPDNNSSGVNILLAVSGLGAITDLNFTFPTVGGGCSTSAASTVASILHPHVGDLVIKLTSPAGTTALLINHRGGARRNFCYTTLDDDGGYPALSTISSDTSQYIGGSFAPETPLSVFDGQDPNGQWVLNVSDTSSSDTGTLKRFALVLSTIPNDIVVDVLDDPNPSTCQPGSCSLREAVTLANSRLGPDRILLPASTQLQLTRAGSNENNNLTGDLDVTDDLEVVGAGSEATVLTQTAADRLFDVTTSETPLTLRNLRLQGGNSVTQGGAINMPNLGVLTITDAVLSDNLASELGGAIYHKGYPSNGPPTKLFLQRVLFENNEASNTTAANAWGGALYSLSSGSLPFYMVIDHCNFYFNSADNGGGALALDGVSSVSGDTMVISGSEFAQNKVTATGGRGGAIATEVDDTGIVRLKISSSLFSGNWIRDSATASAGEKGGAISVNASELVSVSDTLFFNNFAYSGGAIAGASGEISTSTFDHNYAIDSGGAVLASSLPLTIRRSTFDTNSAITSLTSNFGGGAIAVVSGNLSIQRSTLVGNNAVRGGTLSFGVGDLTLIGNTIVESDFLNPGALGSVLRYTGTANAASLNFINNILVGQCSYANAGIQPDASSFNIESNGDTCRLQLPPLQTGNHVLVERSAINLGDLADNGGPTQTRTLLDPSIARDAGDSLACTYTAPLDQRGYYKTDNRCDIGAVEVGGMVDSLFADGFDAW